MRQVLSFTALTVERTVALACMREILPELSVVAINPVNGELAGVMLCDDYGRPPIENLDADVIAPVLDMLGQFQQQYQQARPFGPNEVFHTFMASVWPAYQGRGIGRSIFELSFGVGRAGLPLRRLRVHLYSYADDLPRALPPPGFRSDPLRRLRVRGCPGVRQGG
jgi:hypothetical protein